MPTLAYILKTVIPAYAGMTVLELLVNIYLNLTVGLTPLYRIGSLVVFLTSSITA
jgi:hypothetical protein